MTTTLDDHIGALDVEAVAGQARTLRLAFDDAPGGAWTIAAGYSATALASFTVDGTDVEVTLTGDQVSSLLAAGRYRIRQDGADRIGGRFRPAKPQATPGPDTVTVVLAEASTVAVTTISSNIHGGIL